MTGDRVSQNPLPLHEVSLRASDGELIVSVLPSGWTEVWAKDPTPRKLGADSFYIVVSRLAAAFGPPGALRPISLDGIECEAVLTLSEGHTSIGVEHDGVEKIIHLLDSKVPRWDGHLSFSASEVALARAEIFGLIAWASPRDFWREA